MKSDRKTTLHPKHRLYLRFICKYRINKLLLQNVGPLIYMLSAYKNRDNRRSRKDDILKDIFKNSGGDALKQDIEANDMEKRKRWLKEQAVSDILLNTPLSRRRSGFRGRNNSSSKPMTQRRSGGRRGSGRRGRGDRRSLKRTPAMMRSNRSQSRRRSVQSQSSLMGGSIRRLKERSKSVARMVVEKEKGEESYDEDTQDDDDDESAGEQKEGFKPESMVTPEKKGKGKRGKDEIS